jgi:hypothetical protein
MPTSLTKEGKYMFSASFYFIKMIIWKKVWECSYVVLNFGALYVIKV